jgi:hypothetical protein
MTMRSDADNQHRADCNCRVCVPTPAADRFWAKVEKNDGCWLWRGATAGGRLKYGRFVRTAGRGTMQAHRFSFMVAFGWLPTRGVVAHKCDTPLCVRPDHLMAMTQAENVRDMIAKGRARNPLAEAHSAKTHCVNGHAFDEENTYVTPSGARYCRACGRESHRRRAGAPKATIGPR